MISPSKPATAKKPSVDSLMSAGHLRYARAWLWLGIIMIAAVIFLSLIDPPKAVKFVFTKDKIIHCLVYACLTGWFTQIFRHHLARICVALLFIAMGVGVEYLQGMVPNRAFEVMDMLANTTGVILAWLLSYTWLGHVLVWFERACLRKPNYSG